MATLKTTLKLNFKFNLRTVLGWLLVTALAFGLRGDTPVADAVQPPPAHIAPAPKQKPPQTAKKRTERGLCVDLRRAGGGGPVKKAH